ncbi:tetratricopeptide repeat protein [Microscilla marina]|uniref:tetratricopeptide repeat protein n=1 Tax=Microscilla marina TaxID=1027 RepID=UPI0005D47AEF|nr:tetratricopeptide repeat protein [Microscilla marina]
MKKIMLCVCILLRASYAYTQDKAAIDSLQQLLTLPVTAKKTVDIYNKIAEQYKSSDSTYTAIYANKAIYIAKKISYPIGIADAYYNIGWATFMTDSYTKAIELFDQVIKVSQSAHYLKGTANAYSGLGLCYKFKGDFHKALEFFFKALKIDEQLNNQRGLAIRYNNIGLVLKSQSTYNEALVYYRKVLNIAKTIGSKRLTALGYSNIGDIYYRQTHYKQAIVFLQKALNITTNTRNKILMAFDLQKMGEVYLAQKNQAQALYYFNQALHIRQQLGAQARRGETLISLGKTHHLLGNQAMALQCLQEGINIAQKAENPPILQEGVKALADVYYHLGNYKAAFQQQVLFKQLSDSLKDEQVLKDFTFEKARLKFQHEKDSLQLAQEKQQLTLKVKIKTQQSMLNLVGLVAVLVVSIFLLILFLAKQKSNQKLTKSNENTLQANEEILSINESLRATLEVVEKQRDEIKKQQKELSNQHLQLEKAYQSIKILNVAGQEITSILDLPKVLDTVYAHVRQFMEVTNFGIGLYTDHPQTLEYRLVVKGGSTAHAYPIDMSNTNQFAVWCIQHQRPILMNDISSDAFHYIQDFDPEAYLATTSLTHLPQSAIYMPLLIKGKVVGVIVVHGDQKQAYSPHHFNLLRNLSTYVAIAVENANIHEQMDEKNRALEELGKFKQQMANMIAHDLKNPLNNIIGLSEGFAKESIQYNIHQSGLQMLHLIINMLDTQKLEEAELQPKKESEKASALVADARQQVEWLAHTKNLKIIEKTSHLNLLADKELITRVLVNLLSNAIKYSTSNSDILVQAERIDEQFAKVCITDTGLGIPAGDVGKVFDRFYQVQSTPQGQQWYSTGIGLTFCKLAVEAHGGTIGVNSSMNLGSTFWFTIPLGPPGKSSNIVVAPPTVDEHLKKRKQSMGVLLNQEDQQYLKPWLQVLTQYEVYQLSKVKAVLKGMVFQKNSSLYNWKLELEKALYNSNEQKYKDLISKYI